MKKHKLIAVLLFAFPLVAFAVWFFLLRKKTQSDTPATATPGTVTPSTSGASSLVESSPSSAATNGSSGSSGTSSSSGSGTTSSSSSEDDTQDQAQAPAVTDQASLNAALVDLEAQKKQSRLQRILKMAEHWTPARLDRYLKNHGYQPGTTST